MERLGISAIKAIVAMGVAAFLFLLVASFALSRVMQPKEYERVSLSREFPEFDGDRAYRDLEAVVAIGPRTPGSEGAAKTREYIRTQIEAAGLEVRMDAFEADTPLGKREMVNVTGIVQGTEPGVIVLGNHYDTKHFPDFRFVGANDGGSTTAWMIEMARALGPTKEGYSIWLCFFDGSSPAYGPVPPPG